MSLYEIIRNNEKVWLNLDQVTRIVDQQDRSMMLHFSHGQSFHVTADEAYQIMKRFLYAPVVRTEQ